jgi:hypothetical protein
MLRKCVALVMYIPQLFYIETAWHVSVANLQRNHMAYIFIRLWSLANVSLSGGSFSRRFIRH